MDQPRLSPDITIDILIKNELKCTINGSNLKKSKLSLWEETPNNTPKP